MREQTRTRNRMIQAVLLLALAVIMTIAFNARTAKAGQVYTVSVASGYLALRTAPAYDSSNEIGALYSGETVEVTGGYSGEYVWVYSPKLGKQGYVNSKYLIGGGGYSAPSTNYSTSQAYTVSVASGYLALRTAPAYDDRNEIGALYSGETVYAAGGRSGSYLWVYSPKLGKQGYVNADYLIGAGGGNGGYGRYYTVSVASGYLALRTAPAYDDRNEIGSLYSGDTVQYAGSTSGEYWWVYSPKYGKCGYVNSKYLY